MPATNWSTALKPLLKKYSGKPHPLEYKNIYQLLVMVVLSAQDSDKNINKLAPELFAAFPDMAALARADAEALFPFVRKVRNFGNKTKWLLQIAQAVKADKNIPLTMDTLTVLPGIGRKSASVIMREAGKPAEGIIVDLHVVRVAPRIGIAEGTDPKKIEKQLLEAVPKSDWGEAGMAISFLGRETCRPTNPDCANCVMNPHCAFYKSSGSKPAEKMAAPVKKAVAKKAVVDKKVVVKKTTAKKVAKKPAAKKKAPAKTKTKK
jgi:endonuclease-3